MAGYSGTPLLKKLGIKPSMRVLFVNEPESFATDLGPLPEVTLLSRIGRDLDCIILFVSTSSELVRRFASLAHRLKPAGMIWVGWPKNSSGVPTDVTENTIRAHGLASGLVDIKVCAIDDVWSGLKFVYRVKDRKS